VKVILILFLTFVLIMSVSENIHSPIGFSTGALERGNYRKAIDWLQNIDTTTVEISALRFDELEPLVRDLDRLKLDQFRSISFHAPSSFREDQEEEVLRLLVPVYDRGWNIVVHPDVIYHHERWEYLGNQLLIENMDRRKRIGRTVQELDFIFAKLPLARMCLDVAHARQLDTTLTLLFSLFTRFHERIAEIHISELDSWCRHRLMSHWAVQDYQTLPWEQIPDVPVIIESMTNHSVETLRFKELELAKLATGSKQLSYAKVGA